MFRLQRTIQRGTTRASPQRCVTLAPPRELIVKEPCRHQMALFTSKSLSSFSLRIPDGDQTQQHTLQSCVNFKISPISVRIHWHFPPAVPPSFHQCIQTNTRWLWLACEVAKVSNGKTKLLNSTLWVSCWGCSMVSCGEPLILVWMLIHNTNVHCDLGLSM